MMGASGRVCAGAQRLLHRLGGDQSAEAAVLARLESPTQAPVQQQQEGEEEERNAQMARLQRENAQLDSFELTGAEMLAIDALDRGQHLAWRGKDPDSVP